MGKVKTIAPDQKTGSASDLVTFVEELKRQWMATIDALIDPLMIVDENYSIKKANQALAKLVDKHPRDITSAKCYEIFASRTSPCVGCKIKEAALGKKDVTYHLEKIRGDRFFEVTSQPLMSSDAKPKLEGIIQVYRDRTDAKRMQEQLLQSEKLASIGLLAGGVAHEINNPLGGILVFSQMLLREMAKDSPHYNDVVEIEAAAIRCKDIVQNLLDFARKQPEQSSTTKKDQVNPEEALKTALRFAKINPLFHQVTLLEEYNLDAKYFLECDRNKLIHVFLNLIQNAVQAMPDGGSLSLRTYLDKSTAIIEIEDTGIGIPPEHLRKIFDPFFTTKEPGEGTGLGLAIVFSSVDELNGKIEVQSVINEGTLFRINLPVMLK